jgi:hypothetical protein
MQASRTSRNYGLDLEKKVQTVNTLFFRGKHISFDIIRQGKPIKEAYSIETKSVLL